MNKVVKFIFASLFLVLASCSKSATAGEIEQPETQPETPTNPSDSDNSGTTDGKTLIVYFSWSGHTRTVASYIKEFTGADMVEIEVQEPYSSVYNEVTARARHELDNDIRPALKTKVENMDEYDILIVGTPIWGSHLSTPVKSFLASYDLTGKKILPFCTHGGSGTAQSVNDIRDVCPKAEILQSLAVYGSQAENSQDEVKRWLENNGVLSNK